MEPDGARRTYLVLRLGRAGEAAADVLAGEDSRPRVLVWDGARTPATDARARRLRPVASRSGSAGTVDSLRHSADP